MAIKKQITAPNGVVTEYHRVAMVKIDTNQQNTILVHSYLSEAGRQIEKDYEAGLYKDMDLALMNWPYVDARYLNCAYDGNMTITKAYEWLKALPEFEGAEDI
jgi:hypothetical protein